MASRIHSPKVQALLLNEVLAGDAAKNLYALKLLSRSQDGAKLLAPHFLGLIEQDKYKHLRPVLIELLGNRSVRGPRSLADFVQALKRIKRDQFNENM